jgi:CBS domain-containing protein
VTVRDALATYFGPNQTRRAYPVIRNEAVLGVVDRAMLEAQHEAASAADAASAGLRVGDILQGTPVVAMPHETCRVVGMRLAVHGLERVPVVSDRKSLRLIGIVSRSDLIKPSLGHFEEEHKLERFRYLGFGRSGDKRNFAPVHNETHPHG